MSRLHPQVAELFVAGEIPAVMISPRFCNATLSRCRRACETNACWASGNQWQASS